MPLHVCIIGLKCYDHIAGKSVPRYLGGVETQLSILAKGLAAAGCCVSLITYDHGQPDGETFDGVTVFKSYRPEAGVRLARTLHPRLTGLVGAMRRADADIYLQMGAGIETAQTAIGCRAMFPTRRLVFCLASNCDFGSSLTLGKFAWEGKTVLFRLEARGSRHFADAPATQWVAASDANRFSSHTDGRRASSRQRLFTSSPKRSNRVDWTDHG